MKEVYHISGMSCNGCKTHVEQALSKVEGVNNVTVNLQKEEAVVEMPSHIPLEKFQEALKNSGDSYTISFLEHSLLNTDDVQHPTI
jgi:Cu2+-exporting ATPase